MKEKNEIKVSLYMEWFILIILAGIISLLFFVSFKFLSEYQIEKYHKERNIVQTYNQKYISQLERFVLNQGITSEDIDKIDKWTKERGLIYIQIKKNDKWIYSSDYYMDEMKSGEYDFPTFPEDSYYDIDLMDGPVQIFIMGMYSYNIYIMALLLNIIISFLIFSILTMLGIRKKIHYINLLSKDIEILEGGNLEYEVHVEGNDEITKMAKELNAMKISFSNQINEVEFLTKTNQNMITEISHDLRTPLTSVLLYAEILKNKKYKNDEEKEIILDKIIKKIQHMKGLSDGLLNYALNTTEEKFIPIKYRSTYSVFYDELSDMCQYLEEQGFMVKANLQWKKGMILINEEYLIRIIDNISSNILKYADRQGIVLIWDEFFMDEMFIVFENICLKGNGGQESYHIGIRNVRTMMKEMGGKCDVTQTNEMFRLCLRFKYKTEEK